MPARALSHDEYRHGLELGLWLSSSCHDGGLACAQQPSCLAFLTGFTLILRRERPSSLCGCLSASEDANEAVSRAHDWSYSGLSTKLLQVLSV